MARSKTLSREALAVLVDGVRLDGAEVSITAGQLDRKLYLEVNAALEAIGGKWNKKARAHLFDSDPQDALDQITADGAFHSTKQELDQFFTPPALAQQVVEMADVYGRTVLEPSAGRGALVRAALSGYAARVVAVERDAKLAEELTGATRAVVHCANFLTRGAEDFERDRFDRIVMNPPFSRRQDIAHVMHALSLLAPGGKLVAIMSAGVKFRQDRLTTSFRATLADHGGIIAELPPNSFKESGTSVNTVLVTMRAA
jgi:predicted RNA methylase